MTSAPNIGKKGGGEREEEGRVKRQEERKTLSDVTERGRVGMGGERLSNRSSSVHPQEAVCFCGRQALQLNTFQEVF